MFEVVVQLFTEVPYTCSEPCQTSKMGRFMKIVNGFQRLTVSTKRSILDV